MAAGTERKGADTIVFIHGLWMTSRSWEHWIERAESRGYKTLAPAWPGMEVEVEALNADPTPLERLDEVADFAYDWAAKNARIAQPA
jgi:pimeloyl-ACP methyl ester carboxylesterase